MKAIVWLLLPLLLSCVQVEKSVEQKEYPQKWWRKIPADQAASWEILPQAAKKGEVILSKRTELGLLSNFAATPIFFEGQKYASLEGFWQSLKYPESTADPRMKLAQWPHTRAQVALMVGFEAKRAGNFANSVMKKNKINWVTHKGRKMEYRQKGESPFYQLIKRVTVAKINQNLKVKSLLVATGELKLLPDHKQKSNAPKAWRYYDIYMELRDVYKKSK